MSKHTERSKDTFHPKKDEYFKRIKGSQLVELIEDEDVEVRAFPSMCSCARVTSDTVRRFHFQEETVYGLVGEQDETTEVGPCIVHGEAAQDMDEALYLLLDLRDEAEFDVCHINTAIPYPHTQVTANVHQSCLGI